MFAKLYETELGQILVKQDEGDDGPEIRFFFRPEGLGVCSFALMFTDDDEGWDAADASFEKIDESSALDAVLPLIEQAAKTF